MNLVWFKSTDLRIIDNKVLKNAFDNDSNVILVFCVDPNFYKKLKFGERKFSDFKLKFLYESILDLYNVIKKNNGHLNIYFDSPENIIPELVQKYNIEKIFHFRDTTSDELTQLRIIKEKIAQSTKQVEIKEYWGNTVFHIDDLPFSIEEIPSIFTHFRERLNLKKIRQEISVDKTKLNKSIVDIENIDLIMEMNDNLKLNLRFKGGEQEARKRLHYYFYENHFLSQYKKTRNNLLGNDFSSKFSPYLAFGNISGKSIVLEIFKYEREIEKNASTYWLFFELIWRDFFRFSSLKYGNKLFQLTGIKNKTLNWKKNNRYTENLFNKWKNGKTGYPYIDANMIELNKTGYMSNRGRQMVASFLVKDLKIDWRRGAEYFESLLIDHDVASNYGNWNYAAGIGADPREDRYFNVYKQASRYDESCQFVLNWIPELKDHTPENIINVKNLNYCRPIVNIKNYYLSSR